MRVSARLAAFASVADCCRISTSAQFEVRQRFVGVSDRHQRLTELGSQLRFNVWLILELLFDATGALRTTSSSRMTRPRHVPGSVRSMSATKSFTLVETAFPIPPVGVAARRVRLALTHVECRERPLLLSANAMQVKRDACSKQRH